MDDIDRAKKIAKECGITKLEWEDLVKCVHMLCNSGISVEKAEISLRKVLDKLKEKEEIK